MNEAQQEDLNLVLRSIGECISTWANVELSLASIFSRVSHCKPEIADAIWASVASFDAKLKMLNNVFCISHRESTFLRDWDLLQAYVSKQSRLRNKVAHSTLLHVNAERYALEPFFSMSKPGGRLYAPELQSWAKGFNELAGALFWLEHNKIIPPIEPIFEFPIPDLIIRLREKAGSKHSK